MKFGIPKPSPAFLIYNVLFGKTLSCTYLPDLYFMKMIFFYKKQMTMNTD